MSGGRFEYNQFRINDIIEYIENELDQQGKEIPKEDVFSGDHPYYYTHREDVQALMREAIKALQIAFVYAHRVDWYLSGDDGEDSFVNRLNEELLELKNKLKRGE